MIKLFFILRPTRLHHLSCISIHLEFYLSSWWSSSTTSQVVIRKFTTLESLSLFCAELCFFIFCYWFWFLIPKFVTKAKKVTEIQSIQIKLLIRSLPFCLFLFSIHFSFINIQIHIHTRHSHSTSSLSLSLLWGCSLVSFTNLL